jgi:hypothetical protein
MNMDEDLDFNFAASGTIYGARAVMLDRTTQGACLLGTNNAMCVGVTPQQSSQAPGMIGNVSTPFPLAESGTPTGFASGSTTNVPVYGPARRCLIDVDPAMGGQIRPGDLIISSTLGYATRAGLGGPWNQWIIGIALSFASAGQSLNIKVWIFPWQPTGS